MKKLDFDKIVNDYCLGNEKDMIINLLNKRLCILEDVTLNYEKNNIGGAALLELESYKLAVNNILEDIENLEETYMKRCLIIDEFVILNS